MWCTPKELWVISPQCFPPPQLPPRSSPAFPALWEPLRDGQLDLQVNFCSTKSQERREHQKQTPEARTHQPTQLTLWGSNADIPQDQGSDNTAGVVAAFVINADAITDGNGSLGRSFSRVAGYRSRSGVAPPVPCQAPSWWGTTSSPIPGDGQAPARHNPSEVFSRLWERLLNSDGHQRLLEDCKSQYYQGCNQLLLITPLLNICSAFCH